MNKESKEYLKNLIAAGKTAEAIENIYNDLYFKLDNFTFNKEEFTNIQNSIITLSSSFHQLKNAKNIGIVSNNEFTLESNKINYGLLNLIECIPEIDGVLESTPSVQRHKLLIDLRNEVNLWKKQRKLDFDIYLCYAPQDSVAIEDLHTNLTMLGLTVFLSEYLYKVRFGDTFEENLKYAITNSQALILFGSSATLKSKEVPIEYDFFYDSCYISNTANRPLLIYEANSFNMDLVPVKLKNCPSTSSFTFLVETFLLIRNNYNNKSVNNMLDNFNNNKIVAYNELISIAKERNIIQCPNCHFPTINAAPVSWFMVISMVLSTALTSYLTYSSHGILVVLLLSLIGGFIGMVILYLMGNILEYITNKNIVNKPTECLNCKHLIKPRDTNKKFKNTLNSNPPPQNTSTPSIDSELANIKKDFMNDRIITGLERLKSLSLKEKDRLTADKTEELANDFLKIQKDRNLNLISTNVFISEKNVIVDKSLKLLNEYNEYISTLRKNAEASKNYASDALWLYNFLEEAKSEKYYRTFIQQGFSNEDIWILDKDELASWEIPSYNINKLVVAIARERHKVIGRTIGVLALLLTVVILSYAISFLNIYNFSWTNLVSGNEIQNTIRERLQSSNLTKGFFLIAPLMDYCFRIGVTLFSLLVFGMVIFIKKYLKGKTTLNLFMTFSWLTAPFIWLSTFYSILLLIIFIPSSYFSLYSIEESQYQNYWFFVTSVFKIGFVLRLTPYILFFIFLPKIVKFIEDGK
jgi:ABC-type multidrug transport system fused ATPase/permease subunit